jgi:hypothetical protein
MTRRVINDKKGQDRLPSAHHYYNTLNTYEGAKGRRKKEEGRRASPIYIYQHAEITGGRNSDLFFVERRRTHAYI